MEEEEDKESLNGRKGRSGKIFVCETEEEMNKLLENDFNFKRKGKKMT